MKYLTSQASTSLAARGSRPVALVTVTVRSATGGNTSYRWASQADGSYGYQIGGSGPLYRADLSALQRISRSLRPLGGIAAQSGDDVVLVNPDEEGTFVSELFEDCDLDEATVSVDLVFATGAESTSDVIRLAHGIVGEPRIDVRRVVLPWRDAAGRYYCELLNGRIITQKAYPFAPSGNWGRIRPVVLGDLRGQGFDMSTPASGEFPHVPAPAINAQRQRFSLYDNSSDSDCETLLALYDHLIRVPDASRSLGTDYLQLDDNQFELLLRPHRIDDSTQGVENPEYASTHALDQTARVPAGTALFVDVPGANANLGQIGAGATLVAGDVAVHVVYSKVNSGDTNPGQLTIRHQGVGITGHTGLNLNGAGTSVDTQLIGDHLTGWDDLRELSVIVSGAVGTSGVYVRRILVKVLFRCDEVRASFAQQQLYRAQQGFVESAAAATDDYQDGGYLYYTRTADPFTNPADIAEVLLRHREWGLGLRAPAMTDTGETLDDPTDVVTTNWSVSDDGPFSAGDVLLADWEVVTVEAVSGDDLTVTRGALGSRPTSHADGTVIYRFGSEGEVDCASFRSAAGILREVDEQELLTNGCMEGTYAAGLAPGWSKADPDSNGVYSAGPGYTGRYAQQIERTGMTGTPPAMYQTHSPLSVSQWYRLSLFVRSSSGGTSVECAILQTGGNLFPEYEVGSEWRLITYDFQATAIALGVRFRNIGPLDSTFLIDGVSLQRIEPWQMSFALTEPLDAASWLDRTFLPQACMRLFSSEHGRIRASTPWPGRLSVMTLDAGTIVVDHDPADSPNAAPMISLARTPLDEVFTGVSLRYASNALTDGYDGAVHVSSVRSSTGQSVVSVSSGSPLDTLTVASSDALAPKDAADETASHITASGTTVTLPSGDLVSNGVVAGDWLIVRTSYGVFLHQIASVISATQVELVDDPPVFDDLGQWSAGDNLYLAGNEIFGTFQTPTGTTATIFRQLDSLNLTTEKSMQPGDLIWVLASSSDDGTGAPDEGHCIRRARERATMFRLARYQLERTLSFDAPYIRDARTARALRNRLFDAHDRGWLITLTTDLSTLALDVGDQVTVEHDVVPHGSMSGEIIRQSIDIAAGRIEYVIRVEGE